MEVESNYSPPAVAPIVLLSDSFADRLTPIVTEPKSDRHRVIERGLVMILGPGGEVRRGLIEVVRRNEVLIRYL